ncbi:MAG TPA: hypothetical protein VJS45_01835, partial [Acidimicrobiia bacterium]|nr:hypothetical protein [Acidimicrobiia bacterium]
MIRFEWGRTWCAGVAGFSAVMIMGALVPTSVSARPEGGPDVVGMWTQPFEENGASTPRCQKADDGSPGGPGVSPGNERMICKPAAVHAAVLNDGRILYFHGLESQENTGPTSAASLAPSSRDSQARVLDLRSGTPRWRVPTPSRGAHANPNVEPGHQSYDDPLG